MIMFYNRKTAAELFTLSMCFYHVCGPRNLGLNARKKKQFWFSWNAGVNWWVAVRTRGHTFFLKPIFQCTVRSHP